MTQTIQTIELGKSDEQMPIKHVSLKTLLLSDKPRGLLLIPARGQNRRQPIIWNESEKQKD